MRFVLCSQNPHEEHQDIFGERQNENFHGGPVIKICLLLQGTRVRSLVQKLRPYVP